MPFACNHSGIVAAADQHGLVVYDTLQNSSLQAEAQLASTSALTWDISGTLLATANGSGALRVWRVESGSASQQGRACKAPKAALSSLALSPDGKRAPECLPQEVGLLGTAH